ncbi:Oidioi.mRNA.OKI2018_I69.PAR.g10704.t1.cds [Oikopleura dioica]|uniref:Oidioi.mRNA.OKI2018_I69.PAR.g10704.t1.cds n=1 Tax=Oikopleura dioica TaxID=34765 RepID=A0ABN7RVI4_OIKDI|nr:Oidioi.mRNA.OKI2018_I69.PAR.g10704.t1.cds [Oikopleura dioica]
MSGQFYNLPGNDFNNSYSPSSYNSFSAHSVGQQHQDHPNIYNYNHSHQHTPDINQGWNQQVTPPGPPAPSNLQRNYGYGHTNYPSPQPNFGPIGQPVPSRGSPVRPRGIPFRGRGQFNSFAKPKQPGPRPIKATEIKAWLFEWCTQKKLKPEYNFTAKGKYPKVRYICTLKVAGLAKPLEAVQEAKNKKEAQTLCAWEFCEQLVEHNMVNQCALPKKVSTEELQANQDTAIVSKHPPNSSLQTIGLVENGGWSAENARRRLNEFCMEERISCEFETTSHGSQFQHIAISKLTLNIKKIGQITQTAQASNKKTANAQCALNMVRELFKRGLIEKAGEKRRSSSTQMSCDENIEEVNDADCDELTAGSKRKVDEVKEEFDENGNWTLELARSRLSEFFHKQGKQLNCEEKESGGPFNKQFVCSTEIDMPDGQHFTASATAPNKKSAQKKCALSMTQGRSKKQRKDGRAYPDSSVDLKHPIVMPSWGSRRTTPFDDRHLQFKLEELEFTEEERVAITSAVDSVTGYAKTISEKLKAEEEAINPTTEWLITAPQPVGDYCNDLLFKGELTPELVISCQEKPTIKLLTRFTKEFGLLHNPNMVTNDAKNSRIIIEKVVNSLPVRITLSFTSPKMRPSNDTTIIEESNDPSDVLPRTKCLEALAALRRATFFQKRVAPNFNAIPLCRILKFLLNEWSSDLAGLKYWTLQLIIHKALDTSPYPLTAGDGFRRVLAVISSGILLPENVGVRDWCEINFEGAKPEENLGDAAGTLTKQQREDITFTFQSFLRQVSFMNINKILKIDKLEK